MLVHTDVIRYLEFKVVAGSYVFRDGRISKVPSTEMEAVRSPLMGLFEKRRARNFFLYIQNWKEEDPATHQGQSATDRCQVSADLQASILTSVP
jgi:Rab GDP dissociation inhibitor